MLAPFLKQLAELKIALASGSPRRKEILEQAGLTFTVTPNHFPEDLNWSEFESPIAYLRATTEGKINANQPEGYDVTICADTIVECEGKVYNKPDDAQMAKEFITFLAGRMSYVHTAVYIAYKNKIYSDVWSTEVYFDDLNEEQIDAYVALGDWEGKAGGYGIQSMAGSLIKEIRGDFYNVVGLPLNGFCRLLIKALTDESS